MNNIFKCYVQLQMAEIGLCLGARVLALNKINSSSAQTKTTLKQLTQCS